MNAMNMMKIRTNSSFIAPYAFDLLSDSTYVSHFKAIIYTNYVHFSYFVLKYENDMVRSK